MDNARCHVSHKTREALMELGFRGITLPPYTPTFNPCEKFFLALKGKLRMELAARR